MKLFPMMFNFQIIQTYKISNLLQYILLKSSQKIHLQSKKNDNSNIQLKN